MGAADERALDEIEHARDLVRRQERRLRASHEALERANQELESRLAELYFMHEFLRALTSHNRVEDVSALIADGAMGILGAEAAAVYVLDEDVDVFTLTAAQGLGDDAVEPLVPLGAGTLLDRASEANVSVVTGSIGGREAGVDRLLRDPGRLSVQAAVALRSDETVVGAVVLGFAHAREFGVRDVERLEVVADQSSLALQNALLNAELERLSVTDRMTELYNHGYLKQRLDQEVQRALRFGHTLSLIMLDIDDFKAFNDRYGHPKGDDVLRGVSDLIRESLRDMDVAARYGGEEFVVVLPETDREGAIAVAERIRGSIEGCGFAGEGSTRILVTVSVGVATYPSDARTAEKLIEAADTAMYLAKRSGKNQVKSASAI